MKAILALGLSILLLGLRASPCAAETVVLTTLDWPPYTATMLPAKGISSAVISAAFAAEDVDVRYVFLPWNRAIDAARHGASNGFFPAYERPSNPLWVVSHAIGAGPIYFVERRDHPIQWSSLDDLRRLLIGVDAGFVNTKEIDARLTDGRLHGDIADADMQNLVKLADKRIDLAIIDANVFHYLISNPAVASLDKQLVLQSAPLEYKDLFIDFRNDSQGRHFCNLLNLGLIKIHAATPVAVTAMQDQLIQLMMP